MQNSLWEKYAKVLVDYSVKVKKGELTIIRTDSYQSQPLVKEIYKQILLKGGYPVVRMGVEGLNEVYIKNATDEQLEYIDPMTELEYVLKNFDKHFSPFLRKEDPFAWIKGICREHFVCI